MTLILTLAVGKREKDLSVVLAMAGCCFVGICGIFYLRPVVDLMRQLAQMGNVQGTILEILLKAVGIALVSETAGMLCTDAGNGALGKMLQTLGGAAILYLSIPLFQSVLTLIQDILGEL